MKKVKVAIADLVRSDALSDPGGASSRRPRLQLQVAREVPQEGASLIIDVALTFRRLARARYQCPPFMGANRDRLLHSVAYMQYLFKLMSRDAPRRQTRQFRLDAGDLAASGCIGFNRISGDVSVSLIPDIYFYLEGGYQSLRSDLPSWGDRKICVLWRGSTTGAASLDRQSIEYLPRYALCARSRGLMAAVDAGFTAVVQARSPADADDLRSLFRRQDLWRERMSWGEFCQYRYLLDIDGNAGSWSFLKKLLTGSCVIKVESPYEQWFDSGIAAWVHYVPVRRDFSDLEEKIDWCLSNPERSREIGEAGRAFALERDFPTQIKLAIEGIRAVSIVG